MVKYQFRNYFINFLSITKTTLNTKQILVYKMISNLVILVIN